MDLDDAESLRKLNDLHSQNKLIFHQIRKHIIRDVRSKTKTCEPYKGAVIQLNVEKIEITLKYLKHHCGLVSID